MNDTEMWPGTGEPLDVEPVDYQGGVAKVGADGVGVAPVRVEDDADAAPRRRRARVLVTVRHPASRQRAPAQQVKGVSRWQRP